MEGTPPGLVCCVCHGRLLLEAASLRCQQCGRVYRLNRHGFAEMLADVLAVAGTAALVGDGALQEGEARHVCKRHRETADPDQDERGGRLRPESHDEDRRAPEDHCDAEGEREPPDPKDLN